MQIVDPPERDREVDEVLLAAAQQHDLRVPHSAKRRPGGEHERERTERDDGRRDRDHGCGGVRELDPERHYGKENTTGYSLELFVVRDSPGTGETSTDRRRRPERRLAEVLERDALLLVGIDQVDGRCLR